MRFGVKDDSIELQGFRRSEEQIKIFKRLGQDEALHFIELLFSGHVGKRSIAGVRAAIFNEIIEHFLAHLPVPCLTCVVIQVISGLNDLGAETITSGDHVHRFVIESFRLIAVEVHILTDEVCRRRALARSPEKASKPGKNASSAP